jgi:pimeloyl-ACP methyl ester carboxylesterase
MRIFVTTGRRSGFYGSQSARAWSMAVLGVAGLLTAWTPAEAARECEDPSYIPSVGACAHLPSADLYYRDTGPIRTSERRHRGGETVILLHAGSGNADAFELQFEAFAKAGYRTIAYDRKNVGRSSNTLKDVAMGRPIGTTVQDLDDLATYLKVDKFHIVGVAAGGQVALQYAATRPSRVLSLVLAATLGPPGLAANEPTLAALQANISLPFETFCAGPVPSPLPEPLRLINPATTTVPAIRPEHRELGSAIRALNRPAVDVFHQIEEHARHRTFDGCRFTNIGPNQPGLATTDPLNPNTYAKIAAFINVRTLLVAGTGDAFFSPPVHMRLWGSYIAGAQYTQLDTGHAPQFEDPTTFNRRVLRFLKGGHPFPDVTKP